MTPLDEDNYLATLDSTSPEQERPWPPGCGVPGGRSSSVVPIPAIVVTADERAAEFNRRAALVAAEEEKERVELEQHNGRCA